MERWIAETIESILSQKGDFEIEYIVVHGKSVDATVAIAEEYREKIESGKYALQCRGITMQCIFQENTGIIEAINRGFEIATGDLYACLDADNTYRPGALQSMYQVFSTFPHIDWAKGITSTINEKGCVIKNGSCKMYNWDWIQDGIYGQESYFIEQDSVFWRANLWKKSGPIPTHFLSAGDYWLWIQFAKYSPLWSVNIPISNFRKRPGQLSKNISLYKSEQWKTRPQRTRKAWKSRLFFSPQSRLVYKFPKIEPFFLWLYPIIFGRSNNEYIEIVNGAPVKNVMKSYRV